MEGRRQSKTSRRVHKKIESSSSIRRTSQHTKRLQKTRTSPQIDGCWLSWNSICIIMITNWSTMISELVLFGSLSKKMVEYTSTTWTLHRRHIIQPQRITQRLTDGKTVQEPMETVSLDGWANLYAPQTLFNS